MVIHRDAFKAADKAYREARMRDLREKFPPRKDDPVAVEEFAAEAKDWPVSTTLKGQCGMLARAYIKLRDEKQEKESYIDPEPQI